MNRPLLPRILAAALAAATLSGFPALAAEKAVAIPAPALDAPSQAASETVILAGGCFWGVQGVFQHTKGVTSAVSGYAGGKVNAPSYEQVTTGRTGHAEAVKVTYDPKQVSYGQILRIFFSVVHDPTQLNRQGPDRGTQYRSAVFTTSDAQTRVTAAYIAQLDKAKVYGDPIVTTVKPAPRFWPAETYHQDYATRHPDNSYIAYYDLPKIANLKRMFPAQYRDQPVLVAAK
ncbi:MAG: peptide-methionine (S)-S-oxide reductase MsrA [Sphingomonadales bacterium]